MLARTKARDLKVARSESSRRVVSVVFCSGFIAAAALLRPTSFDSGWREVAEHGGGAMLILAALGRIWAYLHVAGRKDRELCREGPYSLSRNPLYFFSFVGACGAGLALQSLLLTGLIAAAFLTYYHWVIRAEEIRLRALFGGEFDNYCRMVPRFWPRLRGFVGVPSMTISPRLFVRNLTEVFWFLAAILFIEWLEWAKLNALWTTVPVRW